MNFVNGHSSPRFEVRLVSDNSLIDTIDLSLTMSEGLVESYTAEIDIEQRLITGEIIKIPRGYRVKFDMDYSFSTKENTLKIARLLNYERTSVNNQAVYKIELLPRVDILSRKFEVVSVNGNIDIGLFKGGQSAPGNRLIRLAWQTRNMISQMSLVDPDELTVTLNPNYYCII